VVKGFYVDGFTPAFFGALFMTLGGWVFNVLFKE
jgi:hypothetical protein